MSDIQVASRYAKSIFELASEKGVLEATAADFKLIQQVCSQNRDFVVMLENPIIGIDKKWGIIKSIFEGKISELAMTFLNVVTSKNREEHIQSISAAFEEQYNEANGVVKAQLTTTVALEASQLTQFEAFALKESKAKSVQLETAVDDALIGGYILRIGDQLIDNSVKSRLAKLRQSLLAKV
ncbi:MULTISPECIES: ATP synthase F1 subunit delta [Persicobacter]|uniref:ATP synthase subunit delta n=1 Tax=Persicobacter diffluens TaxID=981 RepID=A0AAN4VYA8_9BACT|nr:ATP synthase F1 subunit delta [Persicobacter sp. CCB-QB2]GJM62204.1 hypothetical protein PEDI_27560 [Persicobacter diffluens]